MDTTRPSLLVRLKDPSDADAWQQFHDLYAPLIYRYALARGLAHHDAEEIRSRCYETIVLHIKKFEYDKNRSGFKAWLRTLVTNRTIDLIRKRREAAADSDELRAVPDTAPSPEELFEQQWRLEHLRYCIEQIRREVSDLTYQAFHLLARDGESVPTVCERLGLNANQVYKAKSQVLQLVRQRMTEFED